jgi:hypothetical protein
MQIKLVEWIGSQTCSLASTVTQQIDGHMACGWGQSWSVGAVVIGLTLLLGTAYMISRSIKKARDVDY